MSFKGVPDEHAKDDGNVLFRPSMVGGSTGSTRRLRTRGYPNINQLTYRVRRRFHVDMSECRAGQVYPRAPCWWSKVPVPVVQELYAPAEYLRVSLKGPLHLPAARGPRTEASCGRGRTKWPFRGGRRGSGAWSVPTKMNDVDAERAQHGQSDPSSTFIVLGSHIGTLPGSRGTNVGGLVSVSSLVLIYY